MSHQTDPAQIALSEAQASQLTQEESLAELSADAMLHESTLEPSSTRKLPKKKDRSGKRFFLPAGAPPSSKFHVAS